GRGCRAGWLAAPLDCCGKAKEAPGREECASRLLRGGRARSSLVESRASWPARWICLILAWRWAEPRCLVIGRSMESICRRCCFKAEKVLGTPCFIIAGTNYSRFGKGFLKRTLKPPLDTGPLGRRSNLKSM